jgi:hypothetical protein
MKNSANNQRSNSLNPNNPAHRSAMNNHSNQLNPNNPSYQGSQPVVEKTIVATPPTDKR